MERRRDGERVRGREERLRDRGSAVEAPREISTCGRFVAVHVKSPIPAQALRATVNGGATVQFLQASKEASRDSHPSRPGWRQEGEGCARPRVTGEACVLCHTKSANGCSMALKGEKGENFGRTGCPPLSPRYSEAVRCFPFPPRDKKRLERCPKAVHCHEIVMTRKVELRVLAKRDSLG